MGRHHARVYSEISDVELVGVCDTDDARAKELAEKAGTRALNRAGDLAGKVDAVSIAVPTVYHAEVAQPFLSSGVACLIEKPIAPDVETARRILDWRQDNDIG